MLFTHSGHKVKAKPRVASPLLRAIPALCLPPNSPVPLPLSTPTHGATISGLWDPFLSLLLPLSQTTAMETERSEPQDPTYLSSSAAKADGYLLFRNYMYMIYF
jgi:hypothetical protein